MPFEMWGKEFRKDRQRRGRPTQYQRYTHKFLHNFLWKSFENLGKYRVGHAWKILVIQLELSNKGWEIIGLYVHLLKH